MVVCLHLGFVLGLWYWTFDFDFGFCIGLGLDIGFAFEFELCFGIVLLDLIFFRLNVTLCFWNFAFGFRF